MRSTFALAGLTLFGILAAHAQQAGAERIVVPARNSTRPRLVNVSVLTGGITVKSYSGKEVIVETRASGQSSRASRGPAEVDGLKRLELPGNSGLDIEEEDNVVTVRTRSSGASELVLTVPIDTSLKLRSNSGGAIHVEGVHGEIDAHNLNGDVVLSNVSGTVIAHSLNGAVRVSMDRVDPAKPISFSTLNGDVDVTLPANLGANLKLKTDHGDIFSDFEIKLDLSRNQPVTEANGSRDGKFRVKSDRTMYGTINGGGVEASFTTFNGRISVRKKK